jgi:hypothetical protein
MYVRVGQDSSGPCIANSSIFRASEETKYMLLSRHQNEAQNHNIKTENRSFERVAELGY